MRINRDSLSARAGSIAKEKGVSANVVYSRYFFDCFLKRLSVSSYAGKFVLKGGLFLSAVLGIENRTDTKRRASRGKPTPIWCWHP